VCVTREAKKMCVCVCVCVCVARLGPATRYVMSRLDTAPSARRSDAAATCSLVASMCRRNQPKAFSSVYLAALRQSEGTVVGSHPLSLSAGPCQLAFAPPRMNNQVPLRHSNTSLFALRGARSSIDQSWGTESHRHWESSKETAEGSSPWDSSKLPRVKRQSSSKGMTVGRLNRGATAASIIKAKHQRRRASPVAAPEARPGSLSTL
jgi:hypothetical protein